jgi:steroid 5-alpha reductase family enzyme
LNLFEFISYSAIVVLVYFTVIFILALLKKDNSIVDIAWGVGFVLVALLTFFLRGLYVTRQVLVTTLVFIWGMRLAVHIALRNKGRGEDSRYARWRRDWGKGFALRSFFQVFMLQGLLLLIIVYPVILINGSSDKGLNLWDAAGVVLWLIGFIFESVGDYQLLRFKRNEENRGKIMTQGLWRLTRHPNYFGESVIWWGMFLIALSVENGISAIISPVLITFLLLRVSGVRMLEKKYSKNREFLEYARRTNAFFPWFPKRKT